MEETTTSPAAEYLGTLATFRPTKRPRVAVACQRCKARKQKCDGTHPRCSSCISAAADCQYVAPARASVSANRLYIKALEERITELEREFQGLRRQRAAEAPLDFSHRQPSEEDTISSVDHHSKYNDLPNRVNDPEKIGSLVDVLRDLSLEASGGYVGASSTISMGRLVADIVKRRDQSEEVANDIVEEMTTNRLLNSSHDICSPDSLESVEPMLLSDDVAQQLLDGYLKHISTRWPVLHTAQIAEWHYRRQCLDDAVERSLLHLVYANGGRYLETTGETGNFSPQRHYLAAAEYLEEILQYQDIRAIQVLLLFEIYSLRAPLGPGSWNYVRLAMQMCIELGYHRRALATSERTMGNEMRCRVFWTCYCLDRLVSISLGRPFAISDRDIDVDLPLDIDESCEEITSEIRFGSQTSSTSMSCFRHTIKMRQIESMIQQEVYRVDNSSKPLDEKFDYFIGKLAKWKAEIPVPDSRKIPTCVKPYDGYDYYLHFYYNTLRLLLYPQLFSPDAPKKYISACAEACIGVYNTFKRLHHNSIVGYSLWALQTVFLSGLTLIFCVWHSPEDFYTVAASNALNACSILLYVITERWSPAKRYRNAFEEIKQSVLDPVAEGKHRPRGVIRSLESSLQTVPQNMDTAEDVLISQMLRDMSGYSKDDNTNTVAVVSEPETTNTLYLPQETLTTLDFSIYGNSDLMDAFGHHSSTSPTNDVANQRYKDVFDNFGLDLDFCK